MLPKEGVITFDDIRKELKLTGAITLDDSSVRNLAKISKGIITFKDFYGKSK